MHLQTHMLSGWCAANLLPLTPRDRAWCVVAATIPDIDGLGIVAGTEAYWNFHHVLAHNALFFVITSLGLSLLSERRRLTFLACIFLTHLHLVMDYFGSGPGWSLHYWWPFLGVRESGWMNANTWAFDSWQNKAAAGLLLLWTLAIARFQQRTPLEWIMPSLDRKLVQAIAGKRDTIRHSPEPPPECLNINSSGKDCS